jgi:hypothetical protein
MEIFRFFLGTVFSLLLFNIILLISVKSEIRDTDI